MVGTMDKEPFKAEEVPAECLSEMRDQDQKTHTLLTGSAAKANNVMRCEGYSSLSPLLSIC